MNRILFGVNGSPASIAVVWAAGEAAMHNVELIGDLRKINELGRFR